MGWGLPSWTSTALDIVSPYHAWTHHTSTGHAVDETLWEHNEAVSTVSSVINAPYNATVGRLLSHSEAGRAINTGRGVITEMDSVGDAALAIVPELGGAAKIGARGARAITRGVTSRTGTRGAAAVEARVLTQADRQAVAHTEQVLGEGIQQGEQAAANVLNHAFADMSGYFSAHAPQWARVVERGSIQMAERMEAEAAKKTGRAVEAFEVQTARRVADAANGEKAVLKAVSKNVAKDEEKLLAKGSRVTKAVDGAATKAVSGVAALHMADLFTVPGEPEELPHDDVPPPDDAQVPNVPYVGLSPEEIHQREVSENQRPPPQELFGGRAPTHLHQQQWWWVVPIGYGVIIGAMFWYSPGGPGSQGG